jgi:CheY-like chemotaxis protein
MMNRMSPICFASVFAARFRQGDYVIHFAASGEEALERLADEIEPQLIVILSDTCRAWMG